MKAVSGAANAQSHISLVEVKENQARFFLYPITGKKHQLRIHMSGLGFNIINDRYYPVLTSEKENTFDNPLQLIAKAVTFPDPITKKEMHFESERTLLW